MAQIPSKRRPRAAPQNCFRQQQQRGNNNAAGNGGILKAPTSGNKSADWQEMVEAIRAELRKEFEQKFEQRIAALEQRAGKAEQQQREQQKQAQNACRIEKGIYSRWGGGDKKKSDNADGTDGTAAHAAVDPDIDVSKDGLIVRKWNVNRTNSTLRSSQPFSATVPALGEPPFRYRIFYYELLVKKKIGRLVFGLSCADCPVDDDQTWVGKWPGSFGFYSGGGFCTAGKDHFDGHQTGFDVDDTVGCGMVLRPGGGRNLFFTKNGLLWAKLIPLAHPTSPNNELFPTVSLQGCTTVEANFGRKPFLFRISSFQDQLTAFVDPRVQ